MPLFSLIVIVMNEWARLLLSLLGVTTCMRVIDGLLEKLVAGFFLDTKFSRINGSWSSLKFSASYHSS
jgi:hypothetical protein